MYQCELRLCDGLSYESRMQVCEHMLPNSGRMTSHSMWKFTDVAEEPATLLYGVGGGMGLCEV
jgi:hypothetical protein